MSNINNIAVLTSGGDSPGMNAGIRAVIRTGIYHGKNMFGIRRGYDGLVQGDITPMDAKSVANIIQRGGTILKTARSDEFRTVEGRQKAYENLKKLNIDALVVIGGDGTFTGASKFIEEFDIPIIGMPGTIDNDLNGTDFTIGYDTAINTVVDAVDKIRDTAESHDRLFVVEVMGRDSGLIALRSGISTGAEAVLIPELEVDYDAIMKRLDKTRKNKSSRIIIVAEGDKEGGMVVAEKIQSNFPAYDVRLSILGPWHGKLHPEQGQIGVHMVRPVLNPGRLLEPVSATTFRKKPKRAMPLQKKCCKAGPTASGSPAVLKFPKA
jgi:6-phosphofructokinase 1